MQVAPPRRNLRTAAHALSSPASSATSTSSRGRSSDGEAGAVAHRRPAPRRRPCVVDEPTQALAAGQPSPSPFVPRRSTLHRGRRRPTAATSSQGQVWDIAYLGDWTVYVVDARCRRERCASPQSNATPLRCETPSPGRTVSTWPSRPPAAVILAERQSCAPPQRRRSDVPWCAARRSCGWPCSSCAVPDRPQDQPVRCGDGAAALPAAVDWAAAGDGVCARCRGPRSSRTSRRSSATTSIGSGALVLAHRGDRPRRCCCSSAIPSPTPWRARRRAGAALLVALVILPFWTSFLIRIYAWIGILQARRGCSTRRSIAPGLIDEPLMILNTDMAVLHRPRLRLPALHGAAALRHPRKAGRQPARGGRRTSAAPPWQAVLAGDSAAVVAGHRRRLAALLHPDRRRVRHSRPARRLRDADDRHARSGASSSPTATGRLRRRSPWCCSSSSSFRSSSSARSRRGGVEARAMKRGFHLVQRDRAGVRLRVPLSADPHPDRSIRSTPRGSSPSGAASRRNGTRRCSATRPLLDAAWVSLRIALVSATAATRARHARAPSPSSRLRPLPRPHACSPAWSTRRSSCPR